MGEPHQSRVYSDFARFYDHTFGRIFVDHEHEIIEQLKWRPGQQVLEVGVGTGLSLSDYSRTTKLCGVDISEPMLAKARAALARHNSSACQVLAAGLIQADHGLQAAAAAMQSARWRERIRMECNLGLLAAVATSAPLAGVLGTVLGVIGLLDGLAQAPPAESGLAEPLMGGIAPALVNSAAGFAVAIPAAAASHLFARRVRSTLAQIDSLVQLVLSQMAPLSPAREDLPEQISKAA